MLLPIQTSYVSGAVSVFEKLVAAGESRALVELPTPLHEFLVQCLLDHLSDTDVVHQTLALRFLETSEEAGSVANVHLKQVGDGSLILDGFFPERAKRLRVDGSYFRSIGQAAYATLGARLMVTGKSGSGRFYDTVATSFAQLVRVLRASRGRPESGWAMTVLG